MCTDMYGNLTCSDNGISRYLQAVFNSINMLVIVCGNALALLVVYRTKALQDSAFCFLMSLALSDLLLGLISQPPSLFYSLTCNWPGGPDGLYCQFVGFSICLLCSVSIISLGLVSYERYSYTVHPFHHMAKFTFRRSVNICLIVWLYSGLVSVFPVAGLWDGVGLQPYNALCNIQWEENQVYLWAMLACVLLPSWGLIAFSYFQILKVARKARKIDVIRRELVLGTLVSRIESNVLTTTSDRTVLDNDSYHGDGINSTAPIWAPKTRKRRTNLRDKMSSIKCSLTVTLLVGTFVVCWSPYVLANTVQAIRCKPNPFWTTAFAQWMCFFNSACNPVIYGLTNKTFRDGVRKLLKELRCLNRFS